MSETVTIHPSFEKLVKKLDEPQKDPDKPIVLLSCPWLEGEKEVPVGETVYIAWGPWLGPPMKAHEIPFKALYKGKNVLLSRPSGFNPVPHMLMTVTVKIMERDLPQS